MKKLLITASLFFIFCEGMSQVDSIVRVSLGEVRGIPINYFKQYWPELRPRFTDSSFNSIIDLDTLAIPVLVSLISDTSTTQVENPKDHSYLTKGDVALILINYIEEIPIYQITGIQYCVCCEFGTLPYGFVEDIGKDRAKFVGQYLSYFGSKQRQDYLRTQQKAIRKYHRRVMSER